MSLLQVPPDKKFLFWSADISKLDKNKHQKYITHQILQYGSLEDFKWLKQIYPYSKIKKTFLENPRRTYLPRTFNFVKNYLLKISKPIDSTQYVTI